MKSLKILFSLILLSTLVVSCKPTQEVVYVDRNVEVTVTETIHDTVFLTQPDWSSFVADLVVDSKGQIAVTNTSQENGRHLKAPKVTVKDNKLQVDCKSEAERLFFQWKSKEISKIKVETVNRPAPYPVFVEKDLEWYQLLLIWVGSISLILLLIVGVVMFIRWRKIV